MVEETVQKLISLASGAAGPEIFLVDPPPGSPGRLGVFSSSLNPVTTAHVELVRLAAEGFQIDRILVITGTSNADKTDYECPLSDRLRMASLAFECVARTSVGLSSTPFFVDMVEPLKRAFPWSELFFIVGFDTYERILDRESRYIDKYARSFDDSSAALNSLLSDSRLIVAPRAGQGRQKLTGLTPEPNIGLERVLFLDIPRELARQSATDVRERLRRGEDVAGLVPANVERFIRSKSLYAGIAAGTSIR